MVRLRNLAGQGKFVEFPPNCLQFKGLCMAFYDDLRLPKRLDAYREIKNSVYKKNKAWSHELIEYIAMRLPDDFFKIERDNEAYALFKEVYDKVCDLVKQGHELPQALAPQRTMPVRNMAIAHAHLKQMMQQVGAL